MYYKQNVHKVTRVKVPVLNGSFQRVKYIIGILSLMHECVRVFIAIVQCDDFNDCILTVGLFNLQQSQSYSNMSVWET